MKHIHVQVILKHNPLKPSSTIEPHSKHKPLKPSLTKRLKHNETNKTNSKNKPLKEFRIWDRKMKQSSKHEAFPCPCHFET
jgi:hypothetical protein